MPSPPAVLLNAAQRERLLGPLLKTGGWTMGDGKSSKRDAVSKTFTFQTFVEAFGFMSQVALRAEALNHHPEWFNVYNKVDVTWSTHDCAGLCELDITMADFCDSVYAKRGSGQ